MKAETRDYSDHDLLSGPDGGVCHLSFRGERDAWGHWYSLCGRVVPSWRAWTLADTDGTSVCRTCDAKAVRRGRR